MMAITAIMFALTVSAQTDIYRSAYFHGTHRQINSEWAGLFDNGVSNSKVKTIQMWIKCDTIVTSDNEYLLHTPSGTYMSPGNLLAMFIHGSDTSLHCIWSGNDIHTDFVFDTNWHHVAFTCDTISLYDTLTLFVDGMAMVGGKFLHTTVFAGCATQPQTYIASHVTYLSTSVPVPDAFFYGNMCRLLIADTVFYTSPFIPECAFDSVGYWSGGTITTPYRMVAPLTGGNLYFPAYMYPICDSVYPGGTIPTTETSPCAPTYTFYCPPSDTIHYTSTDTVLRAVNTNASYMRGSHIAMHKNGWLNPSTVTADYTTGVFTDTLVVTSPGDYPYISSYRNDTEKIVVVVHDSAASAGMVSLGKSIIELYPNPVKNLLFIKSPINEGKLNIVNMQGQIVFSRDIQSAILQLDLSALISGVYIIEINGAFIEKIQKE